MRLSAHIGGLGVLGPGLANWPEAAAVLSGRQAYRPAPTVLPTPTILAAAERRRTGRVVKLALAVALEATSQAGENPGDLASVFSSSGGDGHNCHEICQALSLAGREISPTRFANSVHNAAAGYWSIATGSMAESNVLCAFDASFTAGLLEALTQVAVDEIPVLLVAYDSGISAAAARQASHPRCLRRRDGADAAKTRELLGPGSRPRSAALDADRFSDPALEELRCAIPAARSLPLLRLLAAGSRRNGDARVSRRITHGSARSNHAR